MKKKKKKKTSEKNSEENGKFSIKKERDYRMRREIIFLLH